MLVKTLTYEANASARAQRNGFLLTVYLLQNDVQVAGPLELGRGGDSGDLSGQTVEVEYGGVEADSMLVQEDNVRVSGQSIVVNGQGSYALKALDQHGAKQWVLFNLIGGPLDLAALPFKMRRLPALPGMSRFPSR